MKSSHYGSVHTARRALRLAFWMIIDDDISLKNPFGCQFAGVLVNDVGNLQRLNEKISKYLNFTN